MFIPGDNEEQKAAIYSAFSQACAGTFSFELLTKQLMPTISAAKTIILELPIGRRIWILQNLQNNILEFLFTSPSTGTIGKRIDLNIFHASEALRITFTWSPKGISLFVGDKKGTVGLVEGVSFSPGFTLDIFPPNSGNILQIGSEGVEVKHVKIYTEADNYTAAAIKLWEDSLSSIDSFMLGKSEEYVFQGARCRAIISSLVSGFEIYCKNRFLELEQENFQTNFALLRKAFNDKIGKKTIENAKRNPISPMNFIVNERRINFQNWEICQKAYLAYYGINLADAFTENSNLISVLERYLKLRHHLTHSDPICELLNYNEPGKEPIFLNDLLLNTVVENFREIIRLIHECTCEYGAK